MGLTLFDTADWLDDETLCRVAWSRLADPGDVAAARVVQRHGVMAAVRLVTTGGTAGDEDLAGLLRRWDGRLKRVDPRRDMRHARLIGVQVITPQDEAWPQNLDYLGERAPVCLWVKGPARPDWSRSVSIVGARACTSYGQEVAAELAAGLAAAGVTVVSGGAYGIDSAAHRGAVACAGTTVAVLAGGLDRLYPKGNERMLEHLGSHHLLVSEAPVGVTNARWRFLERNRLIASITAATVVVEAAWQSGALSTATHAAEIGRPLGAVPGPITSSTSSGCHRLLRDRGATCVTEVADVLELAGLAPAGGTTGPPPLDPVELRIFDALGPGRIRSDLQVAAEVGMEVRQVVAVLGRMELAGLVAGVPGGWRRQRGATPGQRAG